METGRHRIEIRCGEAPLLSIPPALDPHVTRVERANESVFQVQDDTRLGETLSWLLAAGVQVRAVTPQRAGLEDFFLSAARTPESAADERRTA
jgi:hypothetical protein